MEKIIAEARYAVMNKSGECEMAFIVDERYQGKGIASFLLNCLISIARNREKANFLRSHNAPE
jgi:GNAT superfamily N-acetyltransferase